MSGWGSGGFPWGSPPAEAEGAHPWGGGFWGGALDVAVIARDRLLAFVRNTNAKSLVGVFAERTATMAGLAALLPARLDLDTGEGEALDKLGGILQRPRNGATDEKYRRLLKIQVQLILSSGASVDTLLQIVEIFTGLPAPEYQEAYPSYFNIGAVVSTEEQDELAALLGQAKAGGMRGMLHVQDNDGDGLVLSYTPADPATGAGTLDYTPASPVAGAHSPTYQVPIP